MSTEEDKLEEEKNINTTLLLEPSNEEAMYLLIDIETHVPEYNFIKTKVLKKGKVRRAKLYYMRDRKGKAAKIKEKVNFN